MVAFYITIREQVEVNTRWGKKLKTRERTFMLVVPKRVRAAVRRTWEGWNTTVQECEIPKGGAILALSGQRMERVGDVVSC